MFISNAFSFITNPNNTLNICDITEYIKIKKILDIQNTKVMIDFQNNFLQYKYI